MKTLVARSFWTKPQTFSNLTDEEAKDLEQELKNEQYYVEVFEDGEVESE